LCIPCSLDVVSALEETQTVATHDNNLEKQYQQTVEENTKLKAYLYRARREITHLKGRLAMLELTPAEIREQKYQNLLKQKKRNQQELELKEKHKERKLHHMLSVLSFQERSRTVNAYGDYIVSSAQRKHKRHKTFPSRFHAATSPKKQPLPPMLNGCKCSVCNTQQSLGALSLGKQVHLTKSGQQILLGDRVIIHGDHLGTVKYIGKLEFDPLERVFIGIHLDEPQGITDGAVRGQRYFQCPPSHGIFTLPYNIIGVTGRKLLSSGLPRIKHKSNIAKGQTETRQTTATSKASEVPSSSETPDSLVTAEQTVKEELNKLLSEKKRLEDLINPSVSQMTQRIIQLKSRPHPPTPPVPETAPHQQPEEKTEVEDKEEEPEKDEEPVQKIIHEAQVIEEVDTLTSDNVKELVLSSLQKKDLGDTGFVTIKELNSALLSETLKLTPGQVKLVIQDLGLTDAEGRGIQYQSMAAYIANSIRKLKNNN
jgi:hypothetical protein